MQTANTTATIGPKPTTHSGHNTQKELGAIIIQTASVRWSFLKIRYVQLGMNHSASIRHSLAHINSQTSNWADLIDVWRFGIMTACIQHNVCPICIVTVIKHSFGSQ